MTAGGKKDDALQRASRQIRELLDVPPDQYDLLKDRFWQLNATIRAEAAQAVQRALVERVSQMPHATYSEKKELAKWVNAELRQFKRLALRCPKTGKPCWLQANPGHDPDVGRFRFQHTDGKLTQSTFTSVALPSLEVIPHTVESPEQGRSR